VKIYHSYRNYITVFVLLIIACTHDLIFTKIIAFYGIDMGPSPKDYGIVTNIIASIIIAPLLETIIFQYLPHKGLSYIKPLKNNPKLFNWVYIVFATFLFCLSHCYSLIYIFATIIPGMILAYYFNYLYRKFNYFNAIYFISLLHLSKNLLVLIDQYLLK